MSGQEGGACWEMDSDPAEIRLSILARTDDNARILRSDFMVGVLGGVACGAWHY